MIQSDFPAKITKAFLISAICNACPAHFNLADLITLIALDEGHAYKL
jgi:hypothetical protein